MERTDRPPAGLLDVPWAGGATSISPARGRPMIELQGIHKYYHSGEQPLHVLKGIDLHIREGELVSIMGSSGSGKSTLLNILGILDNHDQGDYFLAGREIKNLKEKTAAHLRNELLGFVFQSFNLLPF